MSVNARAPHEARENSSAELVVERVEQLFEPATRRGFLRMLGVGGTIVFLPSVFAACDPDTDGPTGIVGADGPVSLNLSNDTGILNYAFALEQLEAAFYSAVVGGSVFNQLSAEQQEVMVDLRNHEVIHREFLRRALGTARIGNLAVNTATVNAAISTPANVLRNAEMFEDLGVAAYNGAGKYFTSAANLLLAGKIVSVEARHAAAIRDLRDAAGVTTGAAANTRFAGDDVVLATGAFAGLDVKLEPSVVIARVGATNILSSSTPVSIGTPPATKAGTPDFGPPSPTP